MAKMLARDPAEPFVYQMAHANAALISSLRQEILLARSRVYSFGQPTPLERLVLTDGEPAPEIWVKREDLSPVKAYKWRGACNRMAVLTPEERQKGVVTASAGNHAQGIALAARILGIQARIYMPRPTPRVKQNAVRLHGGELVQIVLAGDSYDEAVLSARADEQRTGAVFVHAYDDLHVIAGQGTLADEIALSGHGPFDAAFLQIGGGGLAAAASCWLKTIWPNIENVGVEGSQQASMKAAFDAGKAVTLDQVDIFCDGTAVRRAGDLPFQICSQTLDRIETVTNTEVSAAIRILWETLRCVSEPSGALGLAAVLKNRAALAGKRVVVIVSGSNIDLLQLALIAQSGGASNGTSRTLRIHIPEQRGTMLRLLDSCFAGLNIAEFQYGKQSHQDAWPVFTFTADDRAVLDALSAKLDANGYTWQDISGSVDVMFRAIPMRGDLLANPLFLRLDFYERSGALHEFLDKVVRGRASICYFNYRQSGERVGRALIGLDFEDAETRMSFLTSLPERGEGYRSCKAVEADVHARLVAL